MACPQRFLWCSPETGDLCIRCTKALVAEAARLQAVLAAARAFVEHVPASNLNWEQFAEYVQQHKALEAGLVAAVKAAEGGEA